jgi:hypothetical protein
MDFVRKLNRKSESLHTFVVLFCFFFPVFLLYVINTGVEGIAKETKLGDVLHLPLFLRTHSFQ